jgi:hypothetical protein
VDSDELAIYNDAVGGAFQTLNPWGATRVAWYFCYYAHVYFGDNRLSSRQPVVPWHPAYSESCRAVSDCVFPPITLPPIEKGLFYPDRKTVRNLVYYGNKGHYDGEINIPGAVVVTRRLPRLEFVTLMRRAINFYSTDHDSISLVEARLCEANAFAVHGPHDFRPVRWRDESYFGFPMVQEPERDLALARRFVEYAT